MITFVWERKWTFVTAILAGLFLAPLVGDLSRDSAYDWYDKTHPVVDYKAELVSRSLNAVLLHIKGVKLRDCLAIENSIQSYVVDLDGTIVDVFEEKITHDPGGSRPVGKVDIGAWRIWPVSRNARQVLVYVQHMCGSHRVMSKIADVELTDVSIDDKGDKGDKGDTGDKGDKGDKGKTGATGPKGEPGKNFWNK